MKTTVRPGDFADGFEPAPAPVVGGDGHLEHAVPRPAVPPRPSLCAAGPCRHYHRLEIQLEAEDPKAQRIPVRLPVIRPGMAVTPDGKETVYRAPTVYYTAVEHYCYPEIGIEMPLGATPVVDCNRWDPQWGGSLDTLPKRRDQFWDSAEGRKHLEALEAWTRARELEAAAALEAERLIAEAEALRIADAETDSADITTGETP